MKNKANIMKNRLLTAFAVLLLPVAVIRAQESSGELKLSLKDAQDYALNNNKMVKSAKLTVEGSQADVWTTISSGLPQISLSAGFTDNLKLEW
jgi:outer membrane protein TolC